MFLYCLKENASRDMMSKTILKYEFTEVYKYECYWNYC